jgi:hypothetical protein
MGRSGRVGPRLGFPPTPIQQFGPLLKLQACSTRLVVPVLVSPPGDSHGLPLRGVKVRGRLHQIEPMAYAFLRQFAPDNNLLTDE